MAKHTPRFCEQCGQEVIAGNRFCDGCGQPVEEAATARERPVTAASRQRARARSTSYNRQRIAWAVIFGLILIPIVLFVIWRDVGEFNADVLYSLLAFVAVTAVLAFFTLRKAGGAWQGTLEEIIAKEKGLQFVFLTDQGKRVSIWGGQGLASYFAPGDRVVKIKGYDYPEKIERAGGRQLCVACGKVYPLQETRCRGCGYPAIDPRDYVA